MCYVKKEEENSRGKRLYILCNYTVYNESFVKHELEKKCLILYMFIFYNNSYLLFNFSYNVFQIIKFLMLNIF